MDIKDMRKLFPVTKKYVFLNNAAESPLNLRFRNKLESFLNTAENEPQNKPSIRDNVRTKLSEILGETLMNTHWYIVLE